MARGKKIIDIKLIIGILFLLVLLVGASYAYFSVEVNYSSNTPTIVTASTGKVDTITLQNVVNNLHINLRGSEMSKYNEGYYYADEELDFLTERVEGRHDLIKLTATKEEENNRYKCNGEIKIKLDITNGSMGSVIKKDDAYLVLDGGNITEKIDLSELQSTNGEIIIPIEINVISGDSNTINGYVSIENKDIEQNYLADKKINVEIEMQNLTCDIGINETEEYIRKYDINKTLSSTKDTSLFRYQGTYEEVTNNYICFGTYDKNECTQDTDKYMYRIIGINEDGQLKIIKKEALPQTEVWHNNSSKDLSWPESQLYKRLNGLDEGNNVFIGTEYLPEGWLTKIADTYNWDKYAAYFNRNTSYKIDAKIGLLTTNDYVKNIEGGTANKAEVLITSWMHLSHNDDDYVDQNEWTMDGGMKMTNGARATSINSTGQYCAWCSYVHYTNNLFRPVFYLERGTIITSGIGTLVDPFIVNE